MDELSQKRTDLPPGTYTVLPSGQVLRPTPVNAPMTDRARAQTLRGHLDLLMSQIDYTVGPAHPNHKIGVLVKPDYLAAVRHALEITK